MTTDPRYRERMTVGFAADVMRRYWHALPVGTRVTDALTMRWSAQRNIVLRKALGLSPDSGDHVEMDRHDGIVVRTVSRRTGERLRDKLVAALPEDWKVEYDPQGDDGRVLITCRRGAGEDEGPGPSSAWDVPDFGRADEDDERREEQT